MTPFWLTLIILASLCIGACLGLLVSSLCVAAANGDAHLNSSKELL